MTDETTPEPDFSEYEGQWVAIRKNRIVASGSTFEEVHAAAPSKSLIAKVATSDPIEVED